MIQVIDEILDGEPKFRIRDENGNILYDNLTIEQITALLKVGTEINKLLFDSINDHLHFISKYHKLDGIIPQAYTMPSLTNDNRQGYTCSWSYTAVITNKPATAYELFGGDGSTYFTLKSNDDTDTPNQLTLNITAPYYLKLETIKMYNYGSFNNRLTILLEGSNDNSNFETIYSGSKDGDITITTNKAFKYFRLKFTNPQSYSVYVRNSIVFVGKYLTTMKKEEATDENLCETCKIGQIIHVEPIDGYIIYDNISYTLKISDNQSIPLPTNLVAGQRYRLVYNGTSFEYEDIYKDIQLTNAIVSLGGSL